MLLLTLIVREEAKKVEPTRMLARISIIRNRLSKRLRIIDEHLHFFELFSARPLMFHVLQVATVCQHTSTIQEAIMVSSLSTIGSSGSFGGSSGSPLPPPDNPLLNAYESFQRDTPTVTQWALTAQAVSWAISWFVDFTLALANVPYFTLVRWELYRLITSIFICSSFFGLLFAYFSFVETGRRMEQSMGSTAFVILFFTIGITSNILYIGMAALIDAMFVNGQYFFVLPSFGIWIVLFGIVSMECSRASSGSVRKLFVIEVPTIYYPLCLFIVFSLFGGGFQLAHLISIGLGYAFGFGYLDGLKVGSTTCRRWEESFLQSLTHLDGWVLSSSAVVGGGDWNDEMMGASPPDRRHGESLWLGSILSQWTGSQRQQQQQPQTISPTLSGRSIQQDEMEDPIPQTGGRQLGGASRRPITDAREARLKAIERRMAAEAEDAV
jgi:membrane associated rhomboid family serine protease